MPYIERATKFSIYIQGKWGQKELMLCLLIIFVGVKLKIDAVSQWPIHSRYPSNQAHLPWVHDMLGVDRVLYALHQVHGPFPELFHQVLLLTDSDTVLPRT